MFKFIYIIIVLFIPLFTGCSRPQSSEMQLLLENADRLVQSVPDSALVILEEISQPDNLDDETFAHWCLLYGNVLNKVRNGALSVERCERAFKWYEKYGNPKQTAEISLYMGRAYTQRDEADKAMTIYIDAYEIAQKNGLYDIAGYLSSYMGDLYENQNLINEAIDRYKNAAGYFQKAGNMKSYICALRDIGREYAFMGDLTRALSVTLKADSITGTINNNELKASITNSLGNIYMLRQEYDKAEKIFLEALTFCQNNLSNNFALIKLYIQQRDFDKARKILQDLPLNDPEYVYPIKDAYYQIYKAEGDFQNALENLEECVVIIDSLIYAESQSKILDIEAKYNNLQIKEEVNGLKIKQQRQIIISVLCICCALLVLFLYFIYRKKATDKIQLQQAELNNTKLKLLDLSLEVEKKKNQLTAMKEKNENVDKLQEEISLLSLNYRNLQLSILTNSTIYKKLRHLANQNIPRNDKPLITKDLWKDVVDEITTVYPNYHKYIIDLCTDLTEQEWQYCCFYIMGFDVKDEAKLLNLGPASVRTKHVRLRQRLNITLTPKTTLYEYLISNMN